MQFRKRGAPVALALAFALVASACSSGGSPSPSSPASPGTSASASSSASASIDPTAPYPSKSGNLPSVKVAQAAPTLSFAAFLVAKDMNFFEYQGVKLEFITLQAGATAIQGVEGGSIDLIDSASTTMASGVARGLDLQAIQNTIMMTLQFCVSKDWAQQHNVTADSTLQEKMAAMKGATIGITAPGDASDRLTRFLLKKYGNLNPDTDTKMVAQAGGSSAQSAALDANQTQGFLVGPPACGTTKNGMILVEFSSQVPEFQNFTFEVLIGSKTWLTAHKDLAAAAATAVSMGNNFILKYPDAALALLKKDFPKVDPSVIETAFNNTIKPQTKPDGKFDASMWQNTSQVLLDAGAITQAVDTSEGSIWTNEYIGDASVH